MSVLVPALAPKWTQTLSPNSPQMPLRRAIPLHSDFADWWFQNEEGGIAEADKLKSVFVIDLERPLSPLLLRKVSAQYLSGWAPATWAHSYFSSSPLTPSKPLGTAVYHLPTYTLRPHFPTQSAPERDFSKQSFLWKWDFGTNC